MEKDLKKKKIHIHIHTHIMNHSAVYLKHCKSTILQSKENKNKKEQAPESAPHFHLNRERAIEDHSEKPGHDKPGREYSGAAKTGMKWGQGRINMQNTNF